MLAVIADSPSLARTQLSDAIAFAQEQSIPLEVVATSELDRPEYIRNDSGRCFFCKDELFTLMEDLCQARGFDAIAYGVNPERPGRFPSRPEGRGQSPRQGATSRCRLDQGRDSPPGSPGWPAHLGQARFGLPFVSHRIRASGYP